MNASAIRVKWRAPVPERQHGQIRGYQVHYVRMNFGEPQGQPAIKDILIEDTQVRKLHCTTSHRNHSVSQSFVEYLVSTNTFSQKCAVD